MLIAARIKQLLEANKIVYKAMPHQRVNSISQAAAALQLEPTQVLTTHVLADQAGMLLVVHPLNSKIDFEKLNRLLQRDLKMLADITINRIFADCEAGCWPPIGHPYDVDVILDKSINKYAQVYLNGGCYTSMLQLRTIDFLFINNHVKILDIAVPITDINTSTPNVMPINNLHFPEFSHVVLTSHKAAEQMFELWQHAFYAAEYARNITVLVPKEFNLDPALSYEIGLYHNFGMFLLSQMFNPEYKLLQKWLKQNPKTSVEILEQRLLGMGQAFDVLRHGHAKLGESLLRHWGVSEPICIVAREHHKSNYNGPYAAYVTIIQITNTLLRQQGIGDGILAELDLRVLTTLGLELDSVLAVVKDIHLGSTDIMQKAEALL